MFYYSKVQWSVIYYLPRYVSCCGMNSCISDSSNAISCESFVMLHNSSWLKSGVICLHNSIWLITLPKLEGPARFSVNQNIQINESSEVFFLEKNNIFIIFSSFISTFIYKHKFVFVFSGLFLTHYTDFLTISFSYNIIP